MRMSPTQEHDRENGERHRLAPLVKETADNLGRLVADHIKLARVELVADSRELGRKMALLLTAASFLALGYALACVALALAVAPFIGAPWAFLGVAGVHLIGGGIALAVVRRSAATTRPLHESLRELDRSAAALSPERTE
jgi:uncharacterized membrane protein YqjE